MLQHHTPQHHPALDADAVSSVERSEGPGWKRPMPRVSSMLFDLEVSKVLPPALAQPPAELLACRSSNGTHCMANSAVMACNVHKVRRVMDSSRLAAHGLPPVGCKSFLSALY